MKITIESSPPREKRTISAIPLYKPFLFSEVNDLNDKNCPQQDRDVVCIKIQDEDDYNNVMSLNNGHTFSVRGEYYFFPVEIVEAKASNRTM